MKAELSRVHWGRILLTSILVVILVIILNTVLLLLATQVWGPPSQAHQIAYLVASWSTFVLQLVLTVLGAVWVARKEESGAPLHGFLVGLVVALILFIFNPALTNFLQGAYRGRLDLLVVVLGTFFLTVAAGWFGGVLGRRGREKS
jgi:hypothetical protein